MMGMDVKVAGGNDGDRRLAGGKPAQHKINIAGTETEFLCAEDDVVVRAALRAGIDLPYECNMGGCGACKIAVVSGDTETLWPDAKGLSDRDRRKGSVLGCQVRPKSDLTLSLRLPVAGVLPADQRPKRHQARLSHRRQLSPNMVELELVTEQPAQFLPGQYALLSVPGIAGGRAYSMSNAANSEGKWRFILRKVAGGAASTALGEHLAIGQTVELDGPYGRAHWRPSERDVVCIAGGSGLAPMISIAAAARREGRSVTLFYGVREVEDLAAVADLAVAAPGTVLVTAISEAAEGWTGNVGHIPDVLAKHALPNSGADLDYYLAGPPVMADAVLKMLVIDRKIPNGQIYFDRFL